MNRTKSAENPINYNKCLIRIRNNNDTQLPLDNLYEGIPQTLLFNFISWFILILIFSILRKRAWDFGRLGLVNRDKNKRKKWTEVFYAREDSIEATTNESSFSQQTLNSSSNYIDNGFFSWIIITFKLKDEHILKYCGPDALHYLSFQRHLIIVMTVITLISICIVLPVNFQGSLIEDVNAFGKTTVANLKPESLLIWVHVIATILFVPLVVLVMRLSSGRNAVKKSATRTIMLKNISPSYCDKIIIERYLKHAYPDYTISSIELAYNVYHLTLLYEKYQRIREARKYCQRHLVEIPANSCSCRKTNALEYYENKEMQVKRRVDGLRDDSLQKPLGIAFVTYKSAIHVKDILAKFKPDETYNWTMSYAPSPSDIFWENLTSDPMKWKFKWIVINVLLFLVLFFLTTPIYIVNLMATFSLYRNATKQFSSVISKSIPTLMLWTLSAVMPAIVSYSEKLLYHTTKSKLNSTIMTKSFGYLLFMILILPSLGLTSAHAFLEFTLKYNETENYHWECVYTPGRGAFYINYIITAAFIGTALELIRLPELIYYGWELFSAKSRAETSYIRQNLINEYPFGIQYAWTIMIFTVSTVYSLASPLIMPFAMVYIGLKHFVDRHNLFFAYGPSNMISQGGGKIHFTAVTMTKMSVLLLLAAMAALTSVRNAGIDTPSSVLIIAMNITLIVFAFTSTIKKCATPKTNIIETPTKRPIYVPLVILEGRESFQEWREEQDESLIQNSENGV